MNNEEDKLPKMDKEYLLKKWLSEEELTEEELVAFKKMDDYQLHVDIVDDIKHFKVSNFSTVDDFDALEKRLPPKNVPVRRLQWVTPFLRIASIFVIAFGVYFLFFFNNDIQIQTLASQKTTIELPDSSTVVLNALSEIRYDEKNWDQNRAINLEGEAFFEVAKGAKFDVVTPKGTVSVLGTKFSVKQREDYFEVTCFEGIVKVTHKKDSKKLIAGETFRIVNGVITFDKTVFQKPSWTNNRSSFKAVPFIEVIAELERQYDLRISLDTKESERLFTGGFVHNNLENALKSITEPLDLTYIIETSNQVIIKHSEQ
ncbi:FecR family protein [Aquimarina rubra]|uniref:FecR family protein n=1 Tax=Aquimarina rubra TaxID=1920033 RepID=A0ABW5LHQ4_9FLAO